MRNLYLLYKKDRCILIPVVLTLFVLMLPFSGYSRTSDSTQVAGTDKKVGKHEVKIGERIFYGIHQSVGKQKSCVSCHNLKYSDTLNWNPSAYAIAESFYAKSFEEFKNIMLSSSGKKLSESHQGYSLTDDEILYLQAFVYSLTEQGGYEQKPDITNLILFAGSILLIILLFVDAVFTKFLKYKLIHGVIVLLLLTYIGKTIYEEAVSLGRAQYYAPDQPVKFSHQVHAGQNQIDCRYCHHSADHSKSAGIPAINVCLNCHTLIREGTHSGKFEINKIHTASEDGTPIQWIRIHKLPDHVYFNHAQHVQAASLDCEECHGPAEEMHILQQVEDLSMGWCLACHRTRKVDFLSNDYYGMTYTQYHEKLKQREIDSLTIEQMGGTECMKCHY